MKRIIIAILLLANMAVGYAQQKNRNSFELGVGYNVFGITRADGSNSRDNGPGAYFEFRNAVAEHFDLGVQLSYKYGKGHTMYISADTPSKDITYNQAGLKGVADYNLWPTRTVCPYAGVSLGAGELFGKFADGTKDHYTYGIIGPRIGVQIWHFRISIEADFAFSGGYMYGLISEPSALSASIGYRF